MSLRRCFGSFARQRSRRRRIDAGVAVGHSGYETIEPPQHAVRWIDGAPEELSTPGLTDSHAEGINELHDHLEQKAKAAVLLIRLKPEDLEISAGRGATAVLHF